MPCPTPTQHLYFVFKQLVSASVINILFILGQQNDVSMQTRWGAKNNIVGWFVMNSQINPKLRTMILFQKLSPAGLSTVVMPPVQNLFEELLLF